MILLVSAFLIMAYNKTFWATAGELFAGHGVQLALFVVALFGLTFAFISAFAVHWLLKPVLIVMVFLSAATSYYMDVLGVMFNQEMIRNIVTTTVTEGKHLITFGYVTHLVVYGLVPAVLIYLMPVKKTWFIKGLLTNIVMVVLGLVLCVGMLLTNFKTYSSTIREHKELLGTYQPGAPVVGMIKYLVTSAEAQSVVVAPLGGDAKPGAALAAMEKPVLMVLFVGETVRAQNFGLSGYERDTTPELAARDVVAFRDVNSCGTNTATSLPCMFSNFDRSNYTYLKGVSNENLLDVLVRAGFDVEWWDNNTGDKNVAARIPSRMLTHTENPEFCSAGECTDGIFRQFLEEKVAGITKNTVLVLHMIGSHGPAYFLRYPPEYKRFTPACETTEFTECSREEVVNAFDNTIAYTDHIVAQTIDYLEGLDGFSTSLLYVSDHGESLGEGGLYLHGTPYWMAPEYQTKVPMVMWMSPGFGEGLGIDRACMGSKVEDTISHANLFHSVLGMLDVETAVYDRGLDVLARCTDRANGGE
jgi:lipid A ethanolaminephosphotransferase